MKTRVNGITSGKLFVDPGEFGKFIAGEIDKWAKVITSRRSSRKGEPVKGR